ncbi:HTH-type transcriptional repressor CytR [Cesiribacter andamanensis AMV16]|uniref:HTH-type transcriptional repressor CytR n=2 Tax=Cesiribacter TaxID=1133570 RepID=M7NK87_9BACT|nr:HTH-type transcriptional repressor CytR [Cesiribacter andamanensis AMV16]
MKSSQITIKDIARALKISPSTVSRALKDHPDISPATKLAVRELAQELDYQPNSVALSLRKSRTHTLGVVIPQIVHHFFSTVIAGIEDVANDAGYQVIICQSNESYEREVQSVQALLGSRVDGMLVSVAQDTQEVRHFQNLINKGMPLVFFDRMVEGLEASSVVVDDFGGAYRATEHLIRQGRKKIAHLAGPENLMISSSRQKGYRQALEDFGFRMQPDLVITAGLTIEEGSEAMRKLLNSGQRPDAIFAANDPLAIGALKFLKTQGISVPEDVAIIGFSDEPITSLIDPPLTTVAQPGYEMGKLATHMLLQQIELKDEEEPELQRKELRTELVIRQSTSSEKKLAS